MVLAVILGCHRLSKGRTFSRSIPSLRDCGEHLAGRPWSIVYPIRRINSFLWIARRAGPPSEGISIGRISWRGVCTTCAMAACSLISARAKFRSPSGSTEQTVISRRATNFRLNLSPRTVWRLLRPAPRMLRVRTHGSQPEAELDGGPSCGTLSLKVPQPPSGGERGVLPLQPLGVVASALLRRDMRPFATVSGRHPHRSSCQLAVCYPERDCGGQSQKKAQVAPSRRPGRSATGDGRTLQTGDGSRTRGQLHQEIRRSCRILWLPAKPVHVRSACESMVCPQFQLCRSGCKTSLGYVLLGLAKILIAPRFFVTKNSGMETEFRQPPDWLEFGFIDVEAVECTRITGIF
jgi:hypothetical protein